MQQVNEQQQQQSTGYTQPAQAPVQPQQQYYYPPADDKQYQQQQQHPGASAPIFIPPNNGQQQLPVYVVQENNRGCDMPIGLILFLCGFLSIIAWWIGACCVPGKKQMNDQEKLWRRVNIAMTVLSAIFLVALIVLYVVTWSVVATNTVQQRATAI